MKCVSVTHLTTYRSKRNPETFAFTFPTIGQHHTFKTKAIRLNHKIPKDMSHKGSTCNGLSKGLMSPRATQLPFPVVPDYWA